MIVFFFFVAYLLREASDAGGVGILNPPLELLATLALVTVGGVVRFVPIGGNVALEFWAVVCEGNSLSTMLLTEPNPPRSAASFSASLLFNSAI